MSKLDMKIPCELTIDWLQAQYGSGKLKPEQVIEEIIRRSREDEGMNIWIAPPVLERIKPYLDRLKTMDTSLPLWGVPFAIKDNIDLAGTPTTAGCPEYAYVPDRHAAVVERLLNAGAIPVGKTNMDQFATGLVGTRSPYGETHNALSAEWISGGSSSGSAVAVARGQAAFALGTDTAGSGRVPAALNRLIGYKPSLGAWSTKGVVPACASLDCVTVFTHSIQEARIVDVQLRGVESSDPWSKEIPRLVDKLPKKLYLPEKPLTFFGPLAEEYSKAWDSAVQRIEQLELPLAYIDYDLFEEAAALLYDGPWVAERWASVGEFIESNPGVTFPVTEQVLRSGGSDKYDAASVFTAMHKLQELRMISNELLQEAVLVMPTCGGTWTREQVEAGPITTNSDMGRYTNHCNLLDLCAVAVPAEDAASQMPFGITLFSLSGNEHLMENAAASFLEVNLPPLEANRQETMLVAVCGLHMRGYPLEKQMLERGSQFIGESQTAEKYQMVKLPSIPAKPGLLKKKAGGSSFTLELWQMPVTSFGAFAALIPAPLGIGKIELADGTEVPGFICEGYAEEEAEDISAYGGWRNIP
ncbi:allophanate hydrolase [Paenibacillus illinoisensis]|uniref:Allophanate hydrolase n=1 Tax=Paenibacillus illinoisensis TaxID=59845 RepID=A0A2W0C0V6_9BACL|nr:allophanate hydrolase [Paenibacillus illinoisensis]PYY25274.1 Allophanate hydrolase [Paenibacillus illinoisensis]